MFSAVRVAHFGKRPARAAKPRDTISVLRTANYIFCRRALCIATTLMI